MIRIPKLWDSLGIKDARQELEVGASDQHSFPMAWIMDKLHSNPAIFHDHRKGYQRKMHLGFQDLKDEVYFQNFFVHMYNFFFGGVNILFLVAVAASAATLFLIEFLCDLVIWYEWYWLG